jgi:WD40 repeat protein
VRIWEGAGRQRIFYHEHERDVHSLAFTADGRQLISGGFDTTVRCWAASGSGGAGRRRDHPLIIRSVAFSPVLPQLACGRETGFIHVWELPTGREVIRLVGHRHRVPALAFSANGKQLASGAGDGTVRLWELESSRELACFSGHRDMVRSVAFTADGAHIVSASRDQTVRVWEAASGRERTCLGGLNTAVMSLVVAKGRRISVGLLDGRLAICDDWEVGEWQFWKGHTETVWGLAFSPDGSRLASRAVDGTTRLWDLATHNGLETIAGNGDVVALATGAPQRRWWSVVRGNETVIESLQDRQVVAWLP